MMQFPVLTHVELPGQLPLLNWHELAVTIYVRNARSSRPLPLQLPMQNLPPGYGLFAVYTAPHLSPTQSMPNEYSLPAVTGIGGLKVKFKNCSKLSCIVIGVNPSINPSRVSPAYKCAEIVVLECTTTNSSNDTKLPL